MTLKKTVLALSLSIAFLGGNGALQAKELRMAPGVPPIHPGYDPLYTEFASDLEQRTDGALTSRLLGQEVTALSQMRTAIRSGLVDIGLFLPAYFPADLPEFNLVGDLAFLGRDPQAVGAALTEYIVTCAECQEELARLGMVYTGSTSTDVYQLLSRYPVRSLEDLRGMRLRAGGPQFARWASAMGASPTSTPVNETFEALSTGVIDGSLTHTLDIIAFQLGEVVDAVTLLNLGTFHNFISHSVSLATWRALDAEQRRAILESAALASPLATRQSSEALSAKALEVALEKGIEFLEPDDSLVAATEHFLSEDLSYVAEQAGSRYGIKDAEEKISRFEALVVKWEGIVREVEHDPARISEALSEHVWNNVSVENYGML